MPTTGVSGKKIDHTLQILDKRQTTEKLYVIQKQVAAQSRFVFSTRILTTTFFSYKNYM